MKYYSVATALSFGLGAVAQVYTLSAVIPWTPMVPSSSDQSQIFNNKYYFSDRTNGGVHVVDLKTNTQVTIIQGFKKGYVNGTLSSGASGPNGLVVVPDKNQLWCGDGDSTIKVIDLATNTIIRNISTGGQMRADEGAYNPKTGVVVIANGDDDSPFVTLVNSTTYAVIGNVSFATAVGIEQPAYNPVDNNFYISIPGSEEHQTGAVSVIPSNGTLSILRTFATRDCGDAGIAFGSPNQLFVSCDEEQTPALNISESFIYDVVSEKVVANVSNVSGVDQASYSAFTGFFYASAYRDIDLSTGKMTPFTAVISGTGTVLQRIPTDNVTAHSLAVNDADGTLVIPVRPTGIMIYKLTAANMPSSANGTATMSMSPSGTATGAPKSTYTGAATVMAAVEVAVVIGAFGAAAMPFLI